MAQPSPQIEALSMNKMVFAIASEQPFCDRLDGTCTNIRIVQEEKSPSPTAQSATTISAADFGETVVADIFKAQADGNLEIGNNNSDQDHNIASKDNGNNIPLSDATAITASSSSDSATGTASQEQDGLGAMAKEEKKQPNSLFTIGDFLIGDYKTTLVSVMPEDITRKALENKNFVNWCNLIGAELAKGTITINKIQIDSIDMFGPNVGFITFKADIVDNNTKKSIPGIVFMRGGAVAILPILYCQGKKYTLLTVQRRVPIANMTYEEIPMGMMDDKSDFKGVAAKEMEKETGIKITGADLIDLTLANDHELMGPSASGDCDERIRLFAFERVVSPQVLKELQEKLTGNFKDDDIIALKIVDVEELRRLDKGWALVALLRYEKQMERGKEDSERNLTAIDATPATLVL